MTHANIIIHDETLYKFFHILTKKSFKNKTSHAALGITIDLEKYEKYQ